MGVVLVVIGAAFLADRLGYFVVEDIWRDLWRYWPVLLIAMGLGKALDEGASRRRSGVWLMMIGGIFLMDTFDVLELHDSWPLFIVAAGIMTVWRAMSPPAPPPPPPSGGTAAEEAIGQRTETPS
jgi:hypothetical protein